MNYTEIKIYKYLQEKYQKKTLKRNENKRKRRACKLKKQLVHFLTLFLILWVMYILLSILWHLKAEEIKIELIWHTNASEFVSVKEYLWLDGCRNIQLEEDHIKHGWMYGFDVACIRGQTFDVYAPTWKDVYEVRVVWYDSRIGNHVILKHWEYWFVFWHTETLLKVGDRVRAGDEIWMVDKSGMTQNYHLHFEVWLHDYNISYKVMYWEEPVYNMENTYKLRKQRGWYVGEEETMDFIADFEGFRECAYDDGNQYSIWYGTISFPWECISKQEAKKRKLDEISRLMENVYKNHFVKYHNQRQALVSATYNLGINSSVTKVKERKTEDGIRDWFSQYVKSSICDWICWWLVKRRTIEADLYLWNIKI